MVSAALVAARHGAHVWVSGCLGGGVGVEVRMQGLKSASESGPECRSEGGMCMSRTRGCGAKQGTQGREGH